MRYSIGYLRQASLAVLCLLASISLNAQDVRIMTLPDGRVLHVAPAGKDVKPIVMRSGDASMHSPKPSQPNSSESRRYIVELTAAPMARAGKERATGRSGMPIETEHQQFRADLSRLGSTASGRGRGAPPSIHLEYTKVLNGFAISATKEVADQIAALPYVQSVYEDQKVRVEDLSSSYLINAHRVWEDYGIRGAGVVIGIIDTGIDYNHPDLGGGIGSGKKVIGGYDFVNMDSDPMDDHGHGTHVAGIAAANGTVTGVAPDAKLVAFKVLASDGFGLDSWIVAAIERSVDPDQNPATPDALDVVNMSLGRDVGGYDPYTPAIANAALYGVTFVVAAGNSGNYSTIGTPGVSPEAITVGATDYFDVVADFSSKGPTDMTYQIKPDVAAPGVSILSTMPSGSSDYLSGTSMASPHVAGAAALLLEKNPDWTPEMVKAALMNTAKEAAEPVWTQGAGRIDVLRAIQPSSIVYPGSISLGRIEAVANVVKTATLTVRNLSGQTRNYQFTTQGNIVRPGITSTFTPASVTLGPGQQSEVVVAFNINGASLPTIGFKEGYFGAVVASSNGEDIRIPVALVHSPVANLVFDGQLPYGVFISQVEGGTYYDIVSPTASPFEILLPPGKFDLFAVYNNTYIFAENIEPGQSIDLSHSRGENNLTWRYNGISGEPINVDPYSDWGALCMFTRGWSFVTFAPILNQTVSDNQYTKFEGLYQTVKDGVRYDLSVGSPAGQSESIVLENNPEAFHEVTVKRPDDGDYSAVVVNQIFNPYVGGGAIAYDMPWSLPASPIMMTDKGPEDGVDINIIVSPTAGSSSGGWTWSTAVYEWSPSGSLKLTDGVQNGRVYGESPLTNYVQRFGRGMLNCRGAITGQLHGVSWFSDVAFNYSSGEKVSGPIDLSFRSDQQPWMWLPGLTNATSLEFWMPSFSELTLPEGKNAVKAEFSRHVVNGVQGVARLQLDFDSNHSDKTPPILEDLKLISDGIESDQAVPGKESYFLLKILDCSTPDGDCAQNASEVSVVKLRITSRATGVVSTFNAESLGSNLYRGDLPASPEGLYDLLVAVEDGAGNALSFDLQPGFFVGPRSVDTPDVFLVSPVDHYPYAAHRPVFAWGGGYGATSYILEVARSAAFNDALTYITSETTFAPPDELVAQEKYFWRVRPVFGDTAGEWSSAFDFTTRGDGIPHLLYPADGEFVLSGWANLIWTEMADRYFLEVSTDPSFQSLVYAGEKIHPIHEGFALTEPVYYWRVQSMFDSPIGSEIGGMSEVFRINTQVKLELIEPANNAIGVMSATRFRWSPVDAWVYVLEISESSNFETLIPDGSIFVADTTYFFDGLNPGRLYYWRVSALRLTGQTIVSEPFVFQTFQELPPVLIAPSHNYNHAYYAPRFEWRPEVVTATYQVQMSESPDFEGANSFIAPTSIARCPVVLPPGVGRYWRVRAIHDSGPGFWSQAFYFITRSADSPTLISPANDSQVDPGSVALLWSDMADRYNVQVAKNADFTGILQEISQLPVSSYTIANDGFTDYFWRVSAVFADNGQTEVGPWSEVFHFSSGGYLDLISPANRSVDVNPARVRFRWQGFDNVDTYVTTISTMPDFSGLKYEFISDEPELLMVGMLVPHITYYWKVSATLENGARYFSPVHQFTTGVITGVETQPETARAYAVPNPAVNGTILILPREEPGGAIVSIMDVSGRAVTTAGLERRTEGGLAYEWNTTEVADGMYFAVVVSRSGTEVVKIAVRK